MKLYWPNSLVICMWLSILVIHTRKKWFTKDQSWCTFSLLLTKGNCWKGVWLRVIWEAMPLTYRHRNVQITGQQVENNTVPGHQHSPLYFVAELVISGRITYTATATKQKCIYVIFWQYRCSKEQYVKAVHCSRRVVMAGGSNYNC